MKRGLARATTHTKDDFQPVKKWKILCKNIFKYFFTIEISLEKDRMKYFFSLSFEAEYKKASC